MTVAARHRLDGLEPDNLLAFLSLLGLLRALDAGDESRAEGRRLCARAAWDIEMPPLRPTLYLARAATAHEVGEAAAEGLEALAAAHDFEGHQDLNYSREAARSLLRREAQTASFSSRNRADLLAALMCDSAIKDGKKDETIDPTPLCLLFGQGHQHFLDRLARVPSEPFPAPKLRGRQGRRAAPEPGGASEPSPPPRQRGRSASTLTAAECLSEALFAPWHRSDATSSFRWDPAEDVRYALMAGDPAADDYKAGTQHGANRLAAVGLPAFTIVPEKRAGRVRPAIIGGSYGPTGFSMAWPIWRQPATISAIRALLTHPDLRRPGALAHLGVDFVVTAQRISVGKFMNFSRGRFLIGPRS